MIGLWLGCPLKTCICYPCIILLGSPLSIYSVYFKALFIFKYAVSKIFKVGVLLLLLFESILMLTSDETDRIVYLQCFRKHKFYLADETGTVLQINLISVSRPTNYNKTKLGKRFHLQRVSYLSKNCSNESRLC